MTTRPQKTKKINHGGSGRGGRGNSTTIDDLDDNMLIQILFKLPSCAPIVACKLINKRWCSLISDPKFAAHFSNHKKENDDKPPWIFIADIGRKVTQHEYCGGNASTNEAVFGSPKFSMGYLPCAFNIDATFKDLVLCSGPLSSRGDLVYYITNSVTKQWVALPSCPGIINEGGFKPWACLVCQQPYDYTQNYKFRVVVIDDKKPPVYEMLVYYSEIGEWKKFNLTISIKPELAAKKYHYTSEFKGVVCNGIIYFYHRLYFAAFNPFDVDEMTDTTTIEAKVLPSLPNPVDGYLCESSGQLFIILMHERSHNAGYDKNGRSITMPTLMVWKLDPNLVPLIWKTSLKGSCKGNLDKIVGIEWTYDLMVSNVGMHPDNDELIYMHLHHEHQLVLCDTRTRLIKPLTDLPLGRSMTFNRLELQWWPTSVPKAYLSNASP